MAHITINDVPYTLSSALSGWQVTALSSPTDRFHRTYHIQTHEDGTPKLCSCGDCTYRGRWCKHLAAVANHLDIQRIPNWTPTAITEDELQLLGGSGPPPSTALVAVLMRPSQAETERLSMPEQKAAYIMVRLNKTDHESQRILVSEGGYHHPQLFQWCGLLKEWEAKARKVLNAV